MPEYKPVKVARHCHQTASLIKLKRIENAEIENKVVPEKTCVYDCDR